MQIEYDKFNEIVKAMVDKLDAKYAHVKTSTMGCALEPFHIGYACAADALEAAMNEHGITVEQV